MNPWRSIREHIIEHRHRRHQRRLVRARQMVNDDIIRRIYAAREKLIRDEASRGIADIEQEINRRQR